MRHARGTELVEVDAGSQQCDAVARVSRMHERHVVRRQRIRQDRRP